MALAVILGVGLLVYIAGLAIYRLYFHPLSHIPGPKLAAITHGYEFYFNVIKGGLFIWEVERMHKVYGPIVRINPREVHIQDPTYYEEIYAPSSRKRSKDPHLMAKFNLPGSGFSTIDSETHRQRRAPVERFFSKRVIENNESLIYKSIDKLLFYINKAHENDTVISLDAGFAALTSDIIYEYVYGFNPGSLDKEGFNGAVRDGINSLMRMSHLLYFFPVFNTIMDMVPLGWLERLNPSVFALADQKRDLYERGVQALNDAHLDHGKGTAEKRDNLINALAAPDIPAHLKSPERLMNEGFALIIGGTETTARTLSVGAWHLFADEGIRRKLRAELLGVMPGVESRPTWNQLERLPYLTGVVNESLRLSTGIGNRSARVAPTETLTYKGIVIPPGTPVSSIHYPILMDPEIFPNPESFDPERWIRASAQGVRLDRYLVNFGKGSRICVGLNLAYAELFLVLALLVRRFDLELHESPKDRLEFARDFGTPWPNEGGLSVRARVKDVVSH
ncbi:cytochrome P450 [Aspergillus karnatakaensis]|uniref:cytochrome P450 n=1 Tax=Aspergillus karnatakaensis TaxID=1810916 RepID=UPI003CCDC17C